MIKNAICREERFSRYTDDDVQTVIRLTPLEKPTDLKFIADLLIATPMGNMPFPQEIVATTIEEAFTKFQSTADTAIEKIQKLAEQERTKQRLVKATNVPPAPQVRGGLVLP